MNRFVIHLSVLVILTGAVSAFAQKPAVAQLYPGVPPEGSSFVRVVNPSGDPVRLNIAGTEEQHPISETTNIATNYKAINPVRPLAVMVDGKPVPGLIKIEPNQTVTLVLKRTGDVLSLTPILDSMQGRNALKADLRVYNLAAGCVANILANKEVKVFSDVPTGSALRRSINPIAVEFFANCGGKASAGLVPPQLQAGSRFSLFVTGDPANPTLSGMADVLQ